MKYFFATVLTIAIPCLLLLTIRQTWLYNSIERDVKNYHKELQAVITENKRKISGIALLTKPQRIEHIAVHELGMRKADSSEITRVSLNTAAGKKG